MFDIAALYKKKQSRAYTQNNNIYAYKIQKSIYLYIKLKYIRDVFIVYRKSFIPIYNLYIIITQVVGKKNKGVFSIYNNIQHIYICI